jgi:hypothetical protein
VSPLDRGETTKYADPLRVTVQADALGSVLLNSKEKKCGVKAKRQRSGPSIVCAGWVHLASP